MGHENLKKKLSIILVVFDIAPMLSYGLILIEKNAKMYRFILV